MDIAITTNGDIAVLLGNGDGTFEPPNYFQGATFPEAITFADFNQDGTMDLALSASGYPTGAGAYVALQTDGASLMFSPTILVFATQLDGTQRSPQSITLTNVGSADLVISKITLNGTDASSFVQKNNCKAGLAPGASCNVSVAFAPKGRGPLGVSLFIADNTLARQQSVPLSGVGSWATLTPASLKFGNQKIGTTSPPQTLTLTNIGSGVFSIRAVLVRDFHPTQFTQSNNCGKSLAAGTSCAITVQFVPTEKGQWQNIVEVRTRPADRFKNPS